MSYYFYNGNIFTEQNMTRAGYNTDEAQLLTDDEVSTYLTDIEEGYQRVNGKLELELIPVIDNSAQTEYNWAKTELATADGLQFKAQDGDLTNSDGDIISEEYVRAYKRALRAYTSTSTDDDGVTTYIVNELSDYYTVNSVNYVVSTDSDTGRPVSPVNNGISIYSE